MKYIRYIVYVGCLSTMVNFDVQASNKKENSKSHANTAAPQKAVPSSQNHAHGASSTTAQPKLSAQAQQLIKEFRETAHAIPEKSKKGERDNHKEYREHVEKAYQAYKKMYEEAKRHKFYLSKQEGLELQKDIRRLFLSRNVSGMPWTSDVREIASK